MYVQENFQTFRQIEKAYMIPRIISDLANPNFLWIACIWYVSNLPAILDARLWRDGAADCEMWNGHRLGF
uniref:Uncharacterized protein n=1 Tax=Ficus carica TaxID=3494 RepID=A0AA87ZGM2_FICCA|nr:hypothetical protein TIFTF001_051561 [Ficus carica]GMN27106.1 hypothetical protein TIFTF001_051562 [Ficus carica]